jgi:TatD DNase family protein
MHCFGGGWEQARRSLDLGFLVSFAGNLTYPKAQPLRDVAARLPLDGVLVETDAPWLAPAPNRGKRNEPAWVRHGRAGSGRIPGVGRGRNRLRHHEKLLRLFGLGADVGN